MGKETARGAWAACGTRRRSRRVDLLATFVVEVPALVCGVVRIYSRWLSVARFGPDDYLMMLVMVGCFSPYWCFGVLLLLFVVYVLTGGVVQVFFVCLEVFGSIGMTAGPNQDGCSGSADEFVAAERGMGVDIWTVDSSAMTVTLKVHSQSKTVQTVSNRGSSSTSPRPSTWRS